MGKTKFYIASKDGQDVSDLIADSKLTLPEDEQEEVDAHYTGPFTVNLELKIDDKTAKRFDELHERFEKEREDGIKACAEYYGVTEDEVRQRLERVEQQMGVGIIPTVVKT